VIKVDHYIESPGAKTLYAMDQDGEMVPLNFTEISARLMDAVVHISSLQTVESGGGYQQLPDPFRDFFGEEFFRRYNEQQRQQQENQPRQGPSPEGVVQAQVLLLTPMATLLQTTMWLKMPTKSALHCTTTVPIQLQ
jgi:S1-C subfamily serine protease